MSTSSDRYAELPKHLAAAAALFHDSEGRVLLVKPTYRDGWLLPGGGMDADEYPWQATRREVREELSIDISETPRLLTVDWTRPRPSGRPGLVAFVFDGGLLTADEAKLQISLPPDELSDWKFVEPDDWKLHVTPGIARRLAACTRALAEGRTMYLQDGWQADEHGSEPPSAN